MPSSSPMVLALLVVATFPHAVSVSASAIVRTSHSVIAPRSNGSDFRVLLGSSFPAPPLAAEQLDEHPTLLGSGHVATASAPAADAATTPQQAAAERLDEHLSSGLVATPSAPAADAAMAPHQAHPALPGSGLAAAPSAPAPDAAIAAKISYTAPYVSLETLQCCVVSVTWVFVIAGLWWRWTLCSADGATGRHAGDADGPSSSAEERCFLLDNAKIVVQFFVIYGHLVFDGRSESGPFNNLPAHTSTWFSGIGNFVWLFLDVTGPYRMPLACFISGVCSQGSMTKRRGRRFIQNLLVPTALWIFCVKPVLHSTLMTLSPWTFWEQLQELGSFHAVQAEWYLTSLVCWRGAAFLVWSHFRPQVALASMLLISCVAGYHSFNAGAGGFLWLDAMFGFMPYFAFGYVFPFREICRLIPEPDGKHRAIAAALVFAWSFVLVPAMLRERLPPPHCMYGGCDAVYATLGFWDQKLFWSWRLARMAIEMMPALCFLLLVIPRSETRFTWIGPHTLYPFLFHNVALSWEDKLLSVLPPPVVTSWYGHVFVLVLHAPVIFLIIVAFASSHWRRLFSWCLEPAWISLLLGDSPSDGSEGCAGDRRLPVKKPEPLASTGTAACAEKESGAGAP